jgi:predicted nuclease of predicted toxin-antitoxin system
VKLLFDQNISFRVPKGLENIFPKAKQVRGVFLENASDRKIWEFAKKEGFTIVTFDADFYDLVTLFGHPPKIIWLRLGNSSTQNIIKCIENHFNLIEAFIKDDNYKNIGCLEIDE